jgi:hypothetical protein
MKRLVPEYNPLNAPEEARAPIQPAHTGG